MSARFEEIDWRPTPMGTISLRRRWDPALDAEVYEVKLDDEYLMSSAFVAAEVEVARVALDALSGESWDVLVGGLGLGYTARAVLDDARVRSLVVVDALAPVIEWHEAGLVPVSVSAKSDERCRLVLGDFFAMARGVDGFDPDEPGRRYDAVVVDIDHSPRHVLHPGNVDFYTPDGLRRLAARIRPGGVFSLWSNDPPDEAYLADLGAVFEDASASIVEFANPLQDRPATNTVYLARAAT